MSLFYIYPSYFFLIKNFQNPAKPTRHIVSSLRSRNEAFLPPNSFTKFWRCHGLIGSFLQTGFDSVRFTVLLSAIKGGHLRGSLKPRML